MAAVALIAGCDKGSLTAPESRADIPEPVASRVLVLAGDTLVIDGRHVALANVVSPQAIPDARCWAEALAAKHAVQTVKGLLREARVMKVTPTGKLDSYGRTLATVSLDGLDLGQTLYDSGVAAKPADRTFRWCEAVSFELDGAPTWSSLSEPGR